MKTINTAVGLGLMAAAAAAQAGGRPAEVQAGLAAGLDHEAGELIVAFHPQASAAARAKALARVGAQPAGLIRAASAREGKGDVQLMKVPSAVALARAIDALSADAAIDYAEPNWIYRHDATSNDPYFTNGSLWGMQATGFGSGAATAWASNKIGGNVWIGVIDEGVMIQHDDLVANRGVNPGEVAGNGVDDDGNGLVDDVDGWDFDGNNASTFDGATDDHGSHCAGTIAARGGNGIGVAGVVWNAKLMSAKFLGKRGGTTANAIKAVDYFTGLKTRAVNSVPFVATNNSWGGGGFSQGLHDAISRASAANILFIAAAGNDGLNNDMTLRYPSSYALPNVIAVAAITSTGALASFSNYGVAEVDLGAPGQGVWSTVPASSKGKVVAGYASYSGTSMATPHVTGAAALYASLNPGASALQIKNAILDQGTPTPSLAGKTVTGDRLNVSGF
jgi:subtilisin family serine protease